MAEGFDHEAFYAALNAERLSRRMTWKQVAEESGVSASTLTRMSQGKHSDVNGFTSLLRWSGLKIEDFTERPGKKQAEPLAQITALLRADAKLSTTSKNTLERIIQTTYEQLRKT
jgi:transcriptional regulator with XRE-family HTH domain